MAECSRTRVRFPPPPPIPEGQPRSVGLFLCGSLRLCGGFCGNLRISPPRRVACSRPDFALSCPFFSRPGSRQNLEVRNHQNFACYKSARYSRTFQPVGWRHCLGGGNHQPAAVLRRRRRDVAASACLIRRVMPDAGCRGSTCP